MVSLSYCVAIMITISLNSAIRTNLGNWQGKFSVFTNNIESKHFSWRKDQIRWVRWNNVVFTLHTSSVLYVSFRSTVCLPSLWIFGKGLRETMDFFFVDENCVWKLVLKLVVMKMFLILDDIDIICGKAEGVYWWILSLRSSKVKNPSPKGFCLGTSWGTIFTRIPQRRFHILPLFHNPALVTGFLLKPILP